MRKFKLILLVTVLSGFAANGVYGQGCSDAGFCTINSFKPNGADSTSVLNNQFKIGAFYGMADYPGSAKSSGKKFFRNAPQMSLTLWNIKKYK